MEAQTDALALPPYYLSVVYKHRRIGVRVALINSTFVSLSVRRIDAKFNKFER